MKLVQAIIPAGLIWIGGSFCARGTKPPYDVDVAIRQTDIAALRSAPLRFRKSQTLLLTTAQLAGTPPLYDLHIHADLVSDPDVEDV